MSDIAISTVTRGGLGLRNFVLGFRNFLVGFIEDFQNAIERRRSYDAIMSELTRLDDKEMSGLGISRADFPAIATGEFKRPLAR